ncbi:MULTISPECIES: hypothetical protein [Paraburkholderia]|jgi:hypothetical protein|uniref:Uncharacterized protein n=1 Tax=Paraburkholderia hospita TaxID=169430 RepID=A0AAN1J6T5_9BURK|nr:hypothetical protein [Paraburkholderia hospita]AUT68549.1 hypothetical protein C2L64_09590 [Paraburkholderia hospita]SEI28016.1 hypothetical protein SAMN05192544_110425 [Paraburkholderia hospita]
MTHDEALRIGRQAAEEARKQVGGNDKDELLKGIEQQAAQKPEVAEAFRVFGHLLLDAHQETKH